MSIELRIVCEIVDTELPEQQNTVQKIARAKTIVSETPDILSILEIAKTIVDNEMNEVRREILDNLASVQRQPG